MRETKRAIEVWVKENKVRVMSVTYHDLDNPRYLEVAYGGTAREAVIELQRSFSHVALTALAGYSGNTYNKESWADGEETTKAVKKFRDSAKRAGFQRWIGG